MRSKLFAWHVVVCRLDSDDDGRVDFWDVVDAGRVAAAAACVDVLQLMATANTTFRTLHFDFRHCPRPCSDPDSAALASADIYLYFANEIYMYRYRSHEIHHFNCLEQSTRAHTFAISAPFAFGRRDSSRKMVDGMR